MNKEKQMRILVEIGHPAHVHFFRNPIRIWRENGHEVTIVTRDKEITHRLLDELGMDYIPITKQRTGFALMAIELLYRWLVIYFMIPRKKIGVAISISGISTALPARLNGAASITCTDTEDARLSNAIAFLFSDAVLVPSTYLGGEGQSNLLKYESFHEMAYLHPNRFTPDVENLKSFGVAPDEKYVVIRLVKWKALHDINEKGISEDALRKIVDLVERKGYKVHISSERELSPEFDRYMIKGKLCAVFDLMAFSQAFIGESPTMAVETAILGRPAALINTRVGHLGNMIELQRKYDMLFNFRNYNEAEGFIENEFFTDETRARVVCGREKLLKDKIDVSAWLAEYVMNFSRDGKK